MTRMVSPPSGVVAGWASTAEGPGGARNLGQEDLDGSRAAAGLRPQGHATAGLDHEALHHRQPQTRPGTHRFRGEERLEYLPTEAPTGIPTPVSETERTTCPGNPAAEPTAPSCWFVEIVSRPLPGIESLALAARLRITRSSPLGSSRTHRIGHSRVEDDRHVLAEQAQKHRLNRGEQRGEVYQPRHKHRPARVRQQLAGQVGRPF